MATVVTALLAGCSSDDRPEPAAWSTRWQEERALVPEAAAFVAGGQASCDELVGELRVLLPRLTPTPSEALDDAVRAWVAHAEAIAFDCPTETGEVDRRLSELHVLASEIDAGLDELG